MISNTSETKESLMRYSILELEEMIEAISANNKGSDGEMLEDADAMEFIKCGRF